MPHSCFGLYFVIPCFLSLMTVSGQHVPSHKSEMLMIKFSDPTKSDFSHWYNGTLETGSLFSYEFSYNISTKNRTAVRISTLSPESSVDYPVIVVVREEQSVVSWQLPLGLKYKYSYREVSRTLCPVVLNEAHSVDTNQKFVVSLSTMSNSSVPYSLQADIIADFSIITSQEKSVVSSPAKPAYYMYTFPPGVESVRVIARSSDNICATLSIQDTRCPVLDLDEDIRYRGRYQTMTTQGAITADKTITEGDSFYIVLVVAPTDEDCVGMDIIRKTREKTFTILVKETLPTSQYYKAILAALGLFLAFYLVAGLIGIYYHGCKKNWGVVDHATFDRSMSVDPDHSANTEVLIRDGNTRTGYGAITDTGSSRGSGGGATPGTDTGATAGSAPGPMSNNADTASINSDEFDFVRDVDHDKDIIRSKRVLHVSDLSKKNEKRMEKNYRLYLTNLFTIAVFYGLPVLQLVMTYQQVLNETGDQDICYYNFACAHPLGRVSAFNNIFSNSGYMMLGVLFLILVKRRAYLHRKAVEKSGERHQFLGIPQYYGLYYAMGLALCMEGFMSGCYHVCPTVSNFQFDTSFMYIMACLCIMKIYQNRHPDISAKSHSAYFVMAIIIILAVIGVIYGTNICWFINQVFQRKTLIYGTNIFWIIFALLYMTASLILSIHLYYMGRWNLDRYVLKRLWQLMRRDWIQCHRPAYLDRMILLLVGNIINWAIALYGVMADTHPDFASYLLGIFIGNLLLLIGFYIISKIFAGEKIPKLTMVLILTSAIIWGFSLYFFVAHLTSWQLTPAGSREGNKECIVLDFYDHHDIWHFLSAISLFFSFLVIMTLDDEIIFKRRDQILVF